MVSAEVSMPKIARLRTSVKKFALLYSAFLIVLLAKVAAAKWVGPEHLKVLDSYYFVQIAVFAALGFVLRNSAKEFLAYIGGLVPIALLSIYVAMVFWLEIGLPY